MKLLVGTRGNFSSTAALIEGTRGLVDEVYLSVFNRRYSSGRTYVHEVDFAELKRITTLAAGQRIDVVVAFNTPCLGGQEALPEFGREFSSYLHRIREAVVGKIILTHPHLIRQARAQHPDLEIIVSVFTEADSVQKVKYYEALGANRLTIPHELNRDPKRLSALLASTTMEAELVLNLACVHYCVRADFHCMAVGHATDAMLEQSSADPYTAWCDHWRLSRPWEVLAADWIRPEDLARYEGIGINYFKIAGRATAVTWQIRAVQAYASRHYDGNLLDLLTHYYPYTDRICGPPPFYIHNPALDPHMDTLYSCRHHCLDCDGCRHIYEKLSTAGALDAGWDFDRIQ